MKYWVCTNGDGRITAASPDTVLGQDPMTIDFPGNFDFTRLHEYAVRNGKLVCHPLPEPEPPIDPRDALLAELQAHVGEQDAAFIEQAAMIAGGGE